MMPHLDIHLAFRYSRVCFFEPLNPNIMCNFSYLNASTRRANGVIQIQLAKTIIDNMNWHVPFNLDQQWLEM